MTKPSIDAHVTFGSNCVRLGRRVAASALEITVRGGCFICVASLLRCFVVGWSLLTRALEMTVRNLTLSSVSLGSAIPPYTPCMDMSGSHYRELHAYTIYSNCPVSMGLVPGEHPQKQNNNVNIAIAFCIDFRPGLHGTSPGWTSPKTKQQFEHFYDHPSISENRVHVRDTDVIPLPFVRMFGPDPMGLVLGQKSKTTLKTKYFKHNVYDAL